jgi:hypothetical protein
MLKKEEIKNGNLVFNRDTNTYGIIQDVGNSREKGDRGISSTPDDELSYSFVDMVSNEVQDGICECSHMTSNYLSIATNRDIDIYLAKLDADSIIELGKAKKNNAVIQDAINRFNKIKNENTY